MDDNFFDWICNEISNFSVADQDELALSQSYLALDECQCKGNDYAGMPNLELLFNKTSPGRDTDENIYY